MITKLDSVEAELGPRICLLFTKPEPSDIPLDHCGFDRIVSLCEVEDDTLLISPELDEVLIKVSQSVGTLD